MQKPDDLDRLTALLEEHGIVPEQGTPERGEGGSWGLSHRYTEEFIEEAKDASGFGGAKLDLLDQFFQQWLYGEEKPTILPEDFD